MTKTFHIIRLEGKNQPSISSSQAALRASLTCRYGTLAFPFVLQLARFYSFLTALIINLISFSMIALKFDDMAVVKDDY